MAAHLPATTSTSNTTPPAANMSAASLRARSSQDLTRAIRSRTDEAAIRKRARTCLAMFYDPTTDPETRAEVVGGFVKPLSGFPTWAVHAAFDAWEAQHSRRPSPAEIRVLAEFQVKPITDEFSRRGLKADGSQPRTDAHGNREDDPDFSVNDLTPEQMAERRAAAEAILAECNFGPERRARIARHRLASSDAEMDAIEAQKAIKIGSPARPSEGDPALMAARRKVPTMRAIMDGISLAEAQRRITEEAQKAALT